MRSTNFQCSSPFYNMATLKSSEHTHIEGRFFFLLDKLLNVTWDQNLRTSTHRSVCGTYAIQLCGDLFLNKVDFFLLFFKKLTLLFGVPVPFVCSTSSSPCRRVGFLSLSRVNCVVFVKILESSKLCECQVLSFLLSLPSIMILWAKHKLLLHAL